LIGRGKIGKSRLALGGVSLPVAYGGTALGKVKVDGGTVLHLALEDGPRRMKTRLREILGDKSPPKRLHIVTGWPRLDEGGLAQLEAWVEQHADTRLIVVDTLKKVRSRRENVNRRL